MRDAIEAADGDTIDFNLDSCPCAIELAGDLNFKEKSLNIEGPGARRLTIQFTDGAMFVKDSTVSISDVSIVGAKDESKALGLIHNEPGVRDFVSKDDLTRRRLIFETT